MKDARINLRVSSDLFSVIKKLSDEYKITISGLVLMVLTESLITSKASDKLKREIRIYIQKVKRKEVCNRMYIIKNMYRRVMDLAFSYFFSTGSVNMKVINTVLDGFVAEFEDYEPSIKNKIGTDFRLTVKRLRGKDYLLNQSKNYKMLNYVSIKK